MHLEFDTAYGQLNDQQKQAVDAIDGPVLVIAGPGTGKTQLLSVRVANILRKTDALPSNILCLTFTESAQTNMQERLSRLIGPLASQVAIHTFHSFGSHIIGTNGDYFQEAFGFKPSDDITRYEILARILEQLPHEIKLAQLYNGDFFYLKDIQARISQLKQAGISPEDFTEIVSRDAKWADKATELLKVHLADITRLSSKVLPNFVNLHSALAEDHDPGLEHGINLSLHQTCLSELQSALALTDGKHTQSLTAWKNRWLIKSSDGTYNFKTSRQLSKLEELTHIYKAYQQELREQRLYDYDDMIMRLIERLKNSDDLRAELQEQYQYILVDEFQDTNGAQQQLLELLAENPINEGRPNVMVVGDDDQAIYGFQGATQSNILDFIDHWPTCLKIILTTNYRSTAPILSFCRQLILLGDNRLETQYADMSKELLAYNSAASQTPRVETLPSQVEQYAWIAQDIKKSIENGQNPLQIAVIAPKHKYLETLVPFLENQSVSVAYERRQDVLQQPHIAQLLLLARVIVHIADGEINKANTYIPELLSAEWWGIPPGWLWEITLEAQKNRELWFEVMDRSERPAIKAIFDWLISMAKHSQTMPLEPMLDQLIGPPEQNHESFTSPYRSYHFNAANLKSSVSYLRLLSGLISLRTSLRQYQPNKQLLIKDFVSFADLRAQAGLTLRNDHPVILDTSAVQLLTAHKAKGLEFENVYVINTDEKTWRQERNRHNNISLTPNLEDIAPAGDNPDEKLRLLYVATTRARQQLTLTTHLTSDEGKQVLPLSWLQSETVMQCIDSSTMTKHDPLSAQELNQAMHSDWITPHFNLRIEAPWQALLQKNLENYQLSPTHLTAFLDVSRGGPKSFLINQLLRFPQALSLNAQFGNVMHKILERLHSYMNSNGELPAMSIAEVWVDEIVEGYYFGPIEEPKAKRRGRLSLQLIYGQYASRIQPGQLSEYDFAGEGSTVDAARIKGRIDALELDKKERTARVVDYKSGSSVEKWLAPTVNTYSAHKAHRYRQQLGFYQLLIEHSRSFQGYQVTHGSLVFIEPNEEGQLIELEMAYSDEEKIYLSKLINKVYDHVKTLNLPDTDHYTPDLKGTLDFENDLLNDVI